MNQVINRRGFLTVAGAVGAGMALGATGSPLPAAAEVVKGSSPTAETIGWRLAGQLYTFRRFSFYEALEMIAALGLKYVEPCFFLKLDKQRPALTTSETLSDNVRKELKAKLAERGIKMANFYTDLGSDEQASRRVFEFARQMGSETLVAEPPPEAFDMIERLCDEFEINLAVHNHPKSPQSKYWKPENVLAVCRGRGKRIGACCDTGHWVRSDLDPVECLKEMEGRIITFHLKDVVEWGNPAARDVPLGTGKANYTAVLKELRRQDFRGVLSIEYEHDSPKLNDEVAQCIAFVEKTVAAF